MRIQLPQHSFVFLPLEIKISNKIQKTKEPAVSRILKERKKWETVFRKETFLRLTALHAVLIFRGSGFPGHVWRENNRVMRMRMLLVGVWKSKGEEFTWSWPCWCDEHDRADLYPLCAESATASWEQRGSRKATICDRPPRSHQTIKSNKGRKTPHSEDLRLNGQVIHTGTSQIASLAPMLVK